MQFQEEYKKRVEQISNLEKFRKEDEMVDFIFKLGRELFDKKIDQIGGEWLINYGGKAVGAHCYLGVKSAELRAKRDILQQQLEENEKTLMLDFKAQGLGITEARAEAKIAVKDLEFELIKAEQDKNNFEHITRATEKMISFIQSVLKQKQNEKSSSSQLYDNSI